MPPYTIRIRDVETHLQELITQARHHRYPILILADDGEALAWLEPLPGLTELEHTRQRALLNAHLTLLKALIQALTEADARPETLLLCKEQVKALYRATEDAPPLFRQVVLLLQMALENLEKVPLKPDQALALLSGLELLQQPAITEDDLRRYNRRLMDSNLYPGIPFEEVLPAYIEES